MPIPKVDADEVSKGIIGVLAMMLEAIQRLGEPVVALFLDLVPERGEALWLKVAAWRDAAEARGEAVDGSDFIRHVLKENAFKIMMPKGCMAHHRGLEMMAMMTWDGVRKRLPGGVTNLDIANVYFGEGEPYRLVREITCSTGCAYRECVHHTPSRNQRRESRR